MIWSRFPGKTRCRLTYLDTNAVVWLYTGLTEKFSATAREYINRMELRISPIVRLELRYLNEIDRITDDADTILGDLANRLGLAICDKDFNAVVGQAMAMSWTRDPFDRIITAQAGLDDSFLISGDKNILKYYPYARW